MAVIQFPDPALSHTGIAVRIQVSEGSGSAAVAFYAPGAAALPYAIFDPSDFTPQEQAANAAAIGLLVAKAKVKIAAMAAAHTDEDGNADPNTIEWVTP